MRFRRRGLHHCHRSPDRHFRVLKRFFASSALLNLEALDTASSFPDKPPDVRRVCRIDSFDFYKSLVNKYRYATSEADARELHVEITRSGFCNDVFLRNMLITVYGKAGDMASAYKVFVDIPDKSDVTWACMVSGFTRNGIVQEACLMLREMMRCGVSPNIYALGSVLKACKELGDGGVWFGMQVHGFTVKSPLEDDTVLRNVMISMYGSFAGFSDCADRAFGEIVQKNFVSWNSLITVYAQRGDVMSVFEIFSAMERDGCLPTEHTYGSLIATGACWSLNLMLQVLTRVTKAGFLSDLYVGSALISGFSQFEGKEYFWDIIKQMTIKSSVTMNGLMMGFVRQKRAEDAVKVFFQMINLVEKNADSYVILLTAFSELTSKSERRIKGQELHCHMIRNCLIDAKVEIQNALINVYSKCGATDYARSVFALMDDKNKVSWSSIISCLDQNFCCEDAVRSYQLMRQNGFLPSNYSLISSLSSCASLKWVSSGKSLHAEAIKLMLGFDVSVSNALLSFYSESNCLRDCKTLFSGMPGHDQVSWNTMIGACSKNSLSAGESVKFLINMLQAGWKPGKITFISSLSAVTLLISGGLTHQIHGLVIKHNIIDDAAIENALISCYAKTGEMIACEKIFARMRARRDEVTWSLMISGYIHSNCLAKAMEFIPFMMRSGEDVDGFIIATVLSACASIAALVRGMEVHASAVRRNLIDVVVGSAVVDMYAKCGRLDYASRFFNLMPVKNSYSWNSMISGYARHGHVGEALSLFAKMKEYHSPDGVTFVGVLSACSHGGLVEEGFKHFTSMRVEFGVTREIQHYSCMVDLLGRAGEFQKMEDFIQGMPMEPNISIWRTILGACSRRSVQNSDLGRKAAEKLISLEPHNASNHVLLSNMYASGGRWDEMVEIRDAMGANRVRKDTGCSWVSMKDGIHAFVSGDDSHPEKEAIYRKLKEIWEMIRMEGYVPQTECSLYDLEDESKEEFLMYHSEKLAVAFVLTRSSEMPIRIMKNLRVCGDCHLAFKYISKVFGRLIVLRDTNRFHHFQNGLCSCRDYW